jgi:AraC-like DNA-binding protein
LDRWKRDKILSSLNDLTCNYGGIAEACRLPDSRRLAVCGIQTATLGVTEVRFDEANFGETGPIPWSDALSLGIQLRRLPWHELSFDNHPMEVRDVQVGDAIFYDLRRNPRANVVDRFHSLHFVFTREFLNEIASDLNVGEFDEIRHPSGVKVRDRVVREIGKRTLSLLPRPRAVTGLYGSHLMIALGIHVATTYGGMHDHGAHNARSLDPVHTRISKELMLAHLDGGIDLRSLAAACHMAPHRFAAAFRKSVGLSPYQWLQTQRMLTARALISKGRYPLRQIASLAGFHDEPHLELTFLSTFGITPAVYRQSFQ